MLSTFCALAVLAAPPADADRVLVIRNASSPTSIHVADYYTRQRGAHNVLAVKCADAAANAGAETIPYAEFKEQIEAPLRAYLAAHTGVDFIVMTKGVPIRIDGAPGVGMNSSRPSVDSFIAALDYDKLLATTRLSVSDSGFTGTAYANRYWRQSEPFSHAKFGGYLVTRLDGYTEADAIALVDRALASEKDARPGKVLLDTCPDFGYADPAVQPAPILAPGTVNNLRIVNELSFDAYNADMVKAAGMLLDKGREVELDKDAAFVGTRTGLAGYVSWGSNDRHFDAAAYRSLRFAPGALAETAVSTSARTFHATTGGQSLIADLVAQGVTGVKGYTDEPLLQAVASPTILFERYSSGATLAESYYAASRFVGWEDIVLGDPICRPKRPRTVRP